MTTVQIQHRIPTTVDTTEVSLPVFFTTGRLSKSYCCMTAEMKLISLHSAGAGYLSIDVRAYDDVDDVKFRLEREFSEAFFEIIDEAIFQHKFSEAHREVFYVVNPNLKPNL